MYTSSSAPIGFLMSQYLYWTCLHLSYRSQLQNKDKKKIFIDYSDIHDYSNIIRDILDIPMILYFKKKNQFRLKLTHFVNITKMIVSFSILYRSIQNFDYFPLNIHDSFPFTFFYSFRLLNSFILHFFAIFSF